MPGALIIIIAWLITAFFNFEVVYPSDVKNTVADCDKICCWKK